MLGGKSAADGPAQGLADRDPEHEDHSHFGGHGIRVNCVAPGLIATENAMKVYVANNMDVNQFCAGFPLQRPGTAEDVASAVVFLASDALSYITGETLGVNGGPALGGVGD